MLDEVHEFERRIVRIIDEINKESASRAILHLLYRNHLSPVEPMTLI